jgi:hypothetical protein
MSTDFYDDNYAFLEDMLNLFRQVSSGTRDDVSGTYPAGRVQVAISQQRSDHTATFVYDSSSVLQGTGRVDLTYQGTAMMAYVPYSGEQGQTVDMNVYPVGDALVAQISYQWYANTNPIGDPTESNDMQLYLSDPGTLTIRVVATDANGQTAEDRKWIQVAEPCGPNAC